MNVKDINPAVLCGNTQTSYKDYLVSSKKGEMQTTPPEAAKVTLSEIGEVFAAGQKVTQNEPDGYYNHWVSWATGRGDFLRDGEKYTCTSPEEKCWEAVCRMAKFMESGSGYLDLSGLKLQDIPTHLPPGVVSLNLADNSLIKLPSLPPSVLSLNINGNNLSKISALPAALIHFSADDNFLKELPPLPSTIRTLSVENNKLVKLPVPLPLELEKINVNHNKELSLATQAFPEGLREIKAVNVADLPKEVPPSVTLVSTIVDTIIDSAKKVTSEATEGIKKAADSVLGSDKKDSIQTENTDKNPEL